MCVDFTYRRMFMICIMRYVCKSCDRSQNTASLSCCVLDEFAGSLEESGDKDGGEEVKQSSEVEGAPEGSIQETPSSIERSGRRMRNKATESQISESGQSERSESRGSKRRSRPSAGRGRQRTLPDDVVEDRNAKARARLVKKLDKLTEEEQDTFKDYILAAKFHNNLYPTFIKLVFEKIVDNGIPQDEVTGETVIEWIKQDLEAKKFSAETVEKQMGYAFAEDDE